VTFKVIIFDFDGVILESVNIKTKAFLKVYEDYPEHADEISYYHLQNSGVSRYKKFVHIHRYILKIPIDEQKIDELAKAFSEAVLEEILKCPFVNGAQKFLDKYSDSCHLYIASGTPENELRFVVDRCKLNKYFKGVYGSPASKSEIIKRILEMEKINNNEALFVGDAITDYRGANEAEISFIARINRDIPDNPFIKMDVTYVNDLKELDELLG